jgi:YVTN family beta-propeller protein
MNTVQIRLFSLAGLLFIGLTTAQAQMTASAPTYQFIKKISLPTGDAKWDYLKMDGEQERVYVSHGDRIHVVDLTTEKQIGEIAGLKGVHGVALAKALHKGYISNGGDNAITIFDDRTFKVLKTLMVEGKKADAIYFDKFSNRVFVFNNGSGTVIAIDANTDEVVGQVDVGGAPEFAVSTDNGRVFNNNEESNEITEFDAKTLAVKNHFSLAPNKIPTGIAFDAVNNRLFSVCRDPAVMVVVDATNGNLIQTLPIGKGTDAVVYEKDLKLVMSSNGEGNVTIVHQDTPDKYTVVQTLTTQPGIKTMVYRGTTHKIYLSGADLQADGKTPVPRTFGVYVYGPSK